MHIQDTVGKFGKNNVNTPKETRINLNLLQLCSKKKKKTQKHVDKKTWRRLKSYLKVIYLLLIQTAHQTNPSIKEVLASSPFFRNGEKCKYKINTGQIASNFTCKLLAIKEALTFYMTKQAFSAPTAGLASFSDSKGALEAIKSDKINVTCAINVLLEVLQGNEKSCILQWVAAHVNIEGNECADCFAKEGRCATQPCTTITLAAANTVAKLILLPHSFKKPPITGWLCLP